MDKPKIYLETTIFNFPFANDAPQYRADTLQLFAEIKAGKFHPYTSEYVILELDNTKNADKLEQMKALITDHDMVIIPLSKEVEQLAKVYITSGLIPNKYETDAFHIAAATIADLDIIISLNFRHIVKHKTIIGAEKVNIREGFKRIFIHTPAEVIDHEENI